jgi:[phosphatase 2A protein]-leucine-carboxy methyltransferase
VIPLALVYFLLAEYAHRISRLELVDEIEELDLVLEHYAITWGLFVPKSAAVADWGQWGLSTKVAAPVDEDEE